MASSRSPTPSRDQPNTWLELAIRNHINELTDADKDGFLKHTPTPSEIDLLSYMKDYDDRHEGLSPLRLRVERVSRFVIFFECLMAPVSPTGRPSKLDIPALVLGGVRAVINLAMTFETFFAKIIDMLCRLADCIEPLAEYAGSNNVVIIEQTAAVIADLLVFCRDTSSVMEKYRDRESVRSRSMEVILQSAASFLSKDEAYRGNFEVELDFCREQNRRKVRFHPGFLSG